MEAAQAFRDKLQALGKDQVEAPRNVPKREKLRAEDLPLAPLLVVAAPTHLVRGKEEGTAVSAAAAAHPVQPPHAQRSEAQTRGLGGTSTCDFASAVLTARFAERLALPTQALAETQVLLDASRYLVSSVTVSAGPEEGMYLSYDGQSANGEGAQHDEEALLRRLEARGLKVAQIHRQA